MGVGRSLPAINQRHLAKEIALRIFRQRQFMTILIGNADPDAATLHQVHRVASLAFTKQLRAAGNVLELQKTAQSSGCLIIKRGKERNRAQRLERHFRCIVTHRKPLQLLELWSWILVFGMLVA